ncbi:uncharacterized protein LOC116604588 [Nematostella vectensis]|uniref:uncharacterized protein LOC116604588 n=1 Tax=Nematostella vectensis TaxID=45351 RepID=UPI00138FBEB3|nr:uncharacterized protein LOC116604588 [Nematostella vectensis]
MSLCFKIKVMCKEFIGGLGLFGGQDGDNKDQKIECKLLSDVSTVSQSSKEQTSARVTSTHGNFESQGVSFNSQQEMESFNSKMVEMRKIFEREIREITLQHDKLKDGRILLYGRVCEMERIIRTEKRKHSISLVHESEIDSTFASEDTELIHQLDGVKEMLECTQKDIYSLKKSLEIEYRERTLYPEPVFICSPALEDDYSKQMRVDGGLKYQGSDMNIFHLITYQCLPPPLSLHELYSRGIPPR